MSRISLAVALAMLLTACAHEPLPPPAPPQAFYGALSLPTAEGPPLDAEALRGKVILATFLATWCFPCLGQLGMLKHLHEIDQARGLQVLVVGMDREGALVLRPFAEKMALPFPVLVANEPLLEGETVLGRIAALPTYLILSRDGEPVTAWAGVAEPADVEKAVDKALKAR